MKLAFRDIEPFVKNPRPEAVAVLVYGPDEGLARERLATLGRTVVRDLNDPFNVTDLRADTLIDDPARLMDEALSQSLMGGRRLVRIRECTDKTTAAFKALLKNAPSACNLILAEAGELGPRSSLRLLFEQAPNAAALPCYVDDARSLGPVISAEMKAAGLGISPDALAFLSHNLLGDRANARAELEKLKIYMVNAPSKTVTEEDAAACLAGGAAQSFEDVARLAASGDIAGTDRALSTLLSEGLAPVAILRATTNYFWRLHLTRSRIDQGTNTEAALAKLSPPVFFKLKPAMESQLRAWRREDLFRALQILRAAEGQCKQTGATDQLLCGRALLAICQMARKTGARAA